MLHFAALSLVGKSVEQPGWYYLTNVAGTLNLLEAMRAAGVPWLVFSSTAAVYREPDEVPLPETAPTRPTNPYGGPKLAVDQLIGFFAKAQGISATSLRYFNVAGAGGALGEDHEPETQLIPLALKAALGERESVKIFGNDYPTPDGTAVRDYIHVKDLGRAHLLALETAGEASPAEPGEHRIYKPRQRRRILRAGGRRDGSERHRPSHRGCRIPAPRRGPADTRRVQQEDPERARLDAGEAGPGGHDLRCLGLDARPPARLLRRIGRTACGR